MGASPGCLRGGAGPPPSGHGAREPDARGEVSQVKLPSFTRRSTGSAASRDRARSTSNSATQSLCSFGSLPDSVGAEADSPRAPLACKVAPTSHSAVSRFSKAAGTENLRTFAALRVTRQRLGVRPVPCRFGTTAASLAEGRRLTGEAQRWRDPKAAEDWPHSKTSRTFPACRRGCERLACPGHIALGIFAGVVLVVSLVRSQRVRKLFRQTSAR
jgi:hypothetical protein